MALDKGGGLAGVGEGGAGLGGAAGSLGMLSGIGGLVMGLGGSLMGGLGKQKDNIVAGLSKHTAHNESVEANQKHAAALQQYMQMMQGLTGDAQRAGQGIFSGFSNQANALRGDARRATNEAAGVYQNYGREAEGVSRQNYANLMGNIQDQQAIARARQGGVSSGQDMVAGGQRAMAMQGLNQNLSDIARDRAQLYGGALERGRERETGLGASILGQMPAVQERAFTLPAQFRQAGINTQFSANTSPTALYQNRNLHLLFGGGGGAGQAFNPYAEIGGSLAGMGGKIMSNAFPNPLETAMTNYYKSKIPTAP
jgi:hypothetical protein